MKGKSFKYCHKLFSTGNKMDLKKVNQERVCVFVCMHVPGFGLPSLYIVNYFELMFFFIAGQLGLYKENGSDLTHSVGTQ